MDAKSEVKITVNEVFPKDPNLRDFWKKFCNNRLTWIPTRNSVICSDHFKISDFQVLANNRRRLVDGTKPTVTPHCTCPSHQLSFHLPGDIRCHAINATLTVPDSLTSSCSSSTPQNAQSKKTAENCSSSPAINNNNNTTIVLTPRKRKMQQQLDYQKNKIKRLQAKNA